MTPAAIITIRYGGPPQLLITVVIHGISKQPTAALRDAAIGPITHRATRSASDHSPLIMVRSFGRRRTRAVAPDKPVCVVQVHRHSRVSLAPWTRVIHAQTNARKGLKRQKHRFEKHR